MKSITYDILAKYLLFFGLLGCGDTLDFFDNELKKLGYIRYRTPLAHAGTGTLIGGKPDQMVVVSHPLTCFPDQVMDANGEWIDTNLRYVDDTNLPSSSENIYFQQEAFVGLSEILGAGTPEIKVRLENEYIKAVSLKMRGSHIEYMDSIALSQYYTSDHMPTICKDYLDSTAFIVQALRVDEMEFIFYDSKSGEISLSLDNIEQFLDISIGLKWRIERNTSLIIESPKYIGFQLGALRRTDEGMALHRATKIIKGKYIFENIDMFDDIEPDPENSAATVLSPVKTNNFHYSLEQILDKNLAIGAD